MRPSLPFVALLLLVGCTARPHPGPNPDPLPFKPGDPVDIARFGVMKTWTGPVRRYPRNVTLQEGVEVEPFRGQWVRIADPAGRDANIGVEWDEPRVFDRVVLLLSRPADILNSSSVELQIWGVAGGKRQPEALVGADSPFAGTWTPVRTHPEVAGGSLTWRLPPLRNGAYKVRVLFRDSPRVALRGFEVYGPSTWRQARLQIATELRDARVEIYNGAWVARGESPAGPMVGADGPLTLLATAARRADSADRTLVTLRGREGAFSFLVDDVEKQGAIVIPSHRTVIRDAARPEAAREAAPAVSTVRRRVAELPEQTFEHALRNIPPKTRNKWLALAPACNIHKFAVTPAGNFFERHDRDLDVEFATGESPDFQRREPQRVERDFLPILIAEWDEGPLRWTQAYCCVPLAADRPESEWTGDETTVLSTRITVKNTAPEIRTATARIRFLRKGRPIKVAAAEGLLWVEDKGALASLDAGADHVRLEASTLAVTLPLDPGASRAVTLNVAGPGRDWAVIDPGARLRRLMFDEARRWTIDYWSARLARGAQFTVPDEPLNRIWKSLLIHQSMWGDRDPRTGRFLPNVAAFAYGPVGNESSQMVKALDMYGDHAMARRYLDPMVTTQGTDSLNARVLSGDGALVGYWAHYTFNTGFILWNAANHYRFTRDRDWLARRAPHIVKACDWIDRERRGTMRTDGRGRPPLGHGFFPPCGLEDLPVWQYWTMTNAYLGGGMRHAAEVLADIAHPDAARIAEAARAFQADLVEGVREATARCPVVKLQDGTWTPYIPKHLHQRGRPTGEGDKGDYEAELGALHLASMDIFPPDSPEVTATLDFHEDVVYLTEAPNDRSILSFARLRDDWFNLGGYGKTQPYLAHTAPTYVRRDEPKQALRSFYNNLVAQNWQDVNAFPEHISRNGGADCKTYEEAMALQQFRTLLLHEEGDALWICPAASRHWFADGKEIAVERAPTHFGPTSFVIRSEAAHGRIVATLHPPLRNPPSAIRLRFRHPEEKPMRRVTVNGQALSGQGGFDAPKECITLRELIDPMEVAAEY